MVPIVPAAALFDLGRGGVSANRPDAALGRQAAEAAARGPVHTGVVGAGTGAVMAGGSLKGGTGTASVHLPAGVVVGALVVVNAAGSPCADDGALYAAGFVDDESLRPPRPGGSDPGLASATPSPTDTGPPMNTTLAVVATNARLDVAQVRRAAGAAHDGLARALRPVHTLFDGDVVFGLSTCDLDAETAAAPGWPGAAHVAGVAAVQAAAADAVMLAVLDAVLASRRVRTPGLDVPGYLDSWPSARPTGY